MVCGLTIFYLLQVVQNTKPQMTYPISVLFKSRACLELSLVCSPTICFQNHPLFLLLCLTVHTSHIIHKCKTSAKHSNVKCKSYLRADTGYMNCAKYWLISEILLLFWRCNFMVIRVLISLCNNHHHHGQLPRSNIQGPSTGTPLHMCWCLRLLDWWLSLFLYTKF